MQFADAALRLGEIEVNRMERRVTRAGSAVELTVEGVCVAGVPVAGRRAGVLRRSELLKEVWQMSP